MGVALSPSLGKAFLDPSSYATTLLVATCEIYGSECLGWDPGTLAMHLEEDLHIDLPAPAMDRLMAAVLLVTTDEFQTDLPTFIQICNILSGGTYSDELWDPATADEIAWALTEALFMWPPDEGDGDRLFSDEIRRYIGKALDDEGVIEPPDLLQIAIRDRNPASIAGEWSDDPEMFGAITQLESDRSDELRNGVAQGLRRLLAQLQALPLKRGRVPEKLGVSLKE